MGDHKGHGLKAIPVFSTLVMPIIEETPNEDILDIWCIKGKEKIKEGGECSSKIIKSWLKQGEIHVVGKLVIKHHMTICLRSMRL